MPNVLQVVSHLDLEASGPSYSVRRLSEELSTQGVNSILCALARDSSQVVISDNENTFLQNRLSGKFGFSSGLQRYIKKVTRSKQIDILHSHGMWMHPNIVGTELCRSHHIPRVVSPRGTLSPWSMENGSKNLKSIFWYLYQKRSLSQATMLHATSETEYFEIRNLGFNQPISIIPNGIDPLLVNRQHQKHGKKYRTLLYLGRIHPKKNIELLLNAWAELASKFPNWRLDIVGPIENNPYALNLEKSVNARGIARVKFSGPAYGEQKIDKYINSDLFVLPTFSENFGMVVAESLMCGTPTLVSRGAPWPDLENEKCGFITSLNPSDFTRNLASALAKDQDELDIMGKAGKAWMERAFSWDKIVLDHQKCYGWLLGLNEKPDCVRSI